jgi:hypothetical protein
MNRMKLTLLFSTAFLMVFSSYMTFAQCGNIALNTFGVTASAISEGTYDGTTHYAYYANDGDKSTSWCSQWDMPAWIVLEFSQVYNFDAIGIWWGSHQHDFIISLSTDNLSWTTVKSGTSNNTEGLESVYELYTINSSNAKYIKIEITTTSAPSSHIFQAAIQEIEAFTNTFTNFALSSNGAIASAISEGTYDGTTHYAYMANDGNENTSWCSHYDMPAWYIVEFDSIRGIDNIGIWWGSHQHNFTISLSVDGINYSSVITSISNNYEGSVTIHQSFPIQPTNAKFLKVEITSTTAPSSHIFQSCFHEIEALMENCPNVPPYTITISQPTSSSIWYTDSSYNIIWNDNFNENVVIDLYKDIGSGSFAQVDQIASSTPSDGSFSWSIPPTIISGIYMIDIHSTLNSDIYVLSDEFNITTPSKIDEISSLIEVKIYPNPTSGKFAIQIETSKAVDLQLKLFNAFGQLLYDDKLESVSGYFEKSVSVGNFPAGVYTIQLSSEEGDVSRMIVLE